MKSQSINQNNHNEYDLFDDKLKDDQDIYESLF